MEIQYTLQKDQEVHISKRWFQGLLRGLVLSTLLLSGCNALESTTRYYVVQTVNPLPSKPPDTVIPIIGQGQIRRSFKVIGNMEFASGRSDAFILEAVSYNARIHGADAVILKEWLKEESHYVDWYPLGRHHSYGYHRHCHYGHHSYGYHLDPFYNVETVTQSSVKAEMIVFLDQESIGFLGIIFEDIRNADYLEIAKVLPGSTAALKGLQPGDQVWQMGDYLCNRGRQDYHEQGPMIKVGETVDVHVRRGGEKMLVTLTGQKDNLA